MEEINVTDIVQNQFASPEIQGVAKDIQTKSNPEINQNIGYDFGNNVLFGKGIQETPDKPSLSFQNTNVQDAFANVDGEWISRYPTYKRGRDNAEFVAQNQTTGEKWLNGFEKLGLKTGTAVLGGTIGVVDSLVEGIAKGSLSEAYNTDFNKWLDTLNEKIDYQLPNYYSKQEQDLGLLGQLGTANFYADKVLGGTAFTLGAILSEAIWTTATGGVGLLSAPGIFGKAGRWTAEALGGERNLLKVMNASKAEAKGALTAELLSASKLTEGVKSASISGYNVTKASNIVLTSLRSAGFEAGMEARQYMKSTEEQWRKNFEQTQGRQPSTDEYNEFKDGLTNSANGVFLLNTAIVGSSNYIQFHNTLFGKTVSNIENASFLEKKLFGAGFDKIEDGTLKAITATTSQKVAGRLYGVAKNVFSEAQEELSQGVVSGTAENYILAAYDPQKTKTTYDLGDAFSEAVRTQYGTTQGLTEGLVGGIVGLLGAGIESGGKFNEVSEKRDNLSKQVDYYNAFTAKMHVNNVIANNKMQLSAEQKKSAQAKGDFTGELLSDRASAIAVIERNYAIDNTKQGVEDFKNQMNALSNEDLK